MNDETLSSLAALKIHACGHVILSRRSAAKDLELRILRSFGVSAPQDDVVTDISSNGGRPQAGDAYARDDSA